MINMQKENNMDVYVRQLDGDDEYFTTLVHVEAKYYYDQGWSDHHIEAEIDETFSHRCSCEHDCCGHWSSYVWPLEKIGKWTWKATIRNTRNI